MAKKSEQTVETKAEQAAVAAQAELPNTPPAGFDGNSTAVTTGAAFAGFRVAKRVTMPTVNPKVGEPVVFRIDDEFRLSTYKSPDAKNEKPATICTVTDMVTGQVLLWLVSEVARKNIEESYPGNDYVGRLFGINKLPKRPGKRYFDFEIAEMEMAE